MVSPSSAARLATASALRRQAARTCAPVSAARKQRFDPFGDGSSTNPVASASDAGRSVRPDVGCQRDGRTWPPLPTTRSTDVVNDSTSTTISTSQALSAPMPSGPHSSLSWYPSWLNTPTSVSDS